MYYYYFYRINKASATVCGETTSSALQQAFSEVFNNANFHSYEYAV